MRAQNPETPGEKSAETKYWLIEEVDCNGEVHVKLDKCYRIKLPLSPESIRDIKKLAESEMISLDKLDGYLQAIFYTRLIRVSEVLKRLRNPINAHVEGEKIVIEDEDENGNTRVYEELLPRPIAKAIKKFIEMWGMFSIVFAVWNGVLWKIDRSGIRTVEGPRDLFLSTLCLQHQCPAKHGIDYIVWENGNEDILDEEVVCSVIFGDECKRVLKELYPRCPAYETGS